MLQGIATLLAMIAFIGVAWWAWSGRRKPDFDAAARLPLAEDEQTKGH
jgi:cytochrome c oxidase cbb3-type subunit 4